VQVLFFVVGNQAWIIISHSIKGIDSQHTGSTPRIPLMVQATPTRGHKSCVQAYRVT